MWKTVQKTDVTLLTIGVWTKKNKERVRDRDRGKERDFGAMLLAYIWTYMYISKKTHIMYIIWGIPWHDYKKIFIKFLLLWLQKL